MQTYERDRYFKTLGMLEMVCKVTYRGVNWVEEVL